MRFKRVELSPANKRQYTFSLGRKDIELLLEETLNAHRYMPNTAELRESKQRLSKISRAFHEALEVAKADGDEGYRIPIGERQKYKTELTKNPMLDITRLEVIDHRPIEDEHGHPTVKGRVLVEYNVKVESSVQDEGRTLKLFVNNRD